MSKPRFKFCVARDNLGVRCERDGGHRGRHAYDLASGGSHQWKETLPTTKKGWVILHPNGEVETDYFQRTTFDDKGVRVSAKRWCELYRPRCKMLKGTLSWVSTG
jgi:hypothetical protein